MLVDLMLQMQVLALIINRLLIQMTKYLFFNYKVCSKQVMG